MTGTRVLATLVVTVLATVVVPPTFAWAVNHRRVLRAEADIAAIAGSLRDDLQNDAPQLRRLAAVVDVLCGPGLVPRADASLGPWITAPRGALASAFRDRVSLPIDPWGNCYAVNLAAITSTEPRAVWVLSAGPDGIIETPFSAEAQAPAGNDVATRIR